MACKPALAPVAMSKAMEAWTENVDLVLRGILEEETRDSAVQELKLASAFLVGATIDMIRPYGCVLGSLTRRQSRPGVESPLRGPHYLATSWIAS